MTLHEFLSAKGSRGLVLTGGPGIGKTTLWEAGIAAARRRRVRVLSTRASEAPARLAFAGLVDLLDGVDSTELGDLHTPQRRALEIAVLRAEPTGRPPELRAIALGFLNLLRALAGRRSLLIAIDDVQWLDPPSARSAGVRGATARDVRRPLPALQAPRSNIAARAGDRAVGRRAPRGGSVEPGRDTAASVRAARSEPPASSASAPGRLDARQPTVRARTRAHAVRRRPARPRRGPARAGYGRGPARYAHRKAARPSPAAVARRRPQPRSDRRPARGDRGRDNHSRRGSRGRRSDHRRKQRTCCTSLDRRGRKEAVASGGAKRAALRVGARGRRRGVARSTSGPCGCRSRSRARRDGGESSRSCFRARCPAGGC